MSVFPAQPVSIYSALLRQSRAYALGWSSPATSAFRMFLYVAMHVPLALAMKSYAPLATAHALACWLFGLGCALSGMRAERIVSIVAYIVASEVLWRSSGADVFYEGAKYAISAIFLCSLLKLGNWRIYWPALVYFILLLPSIAMTLAGAGLRLSRGLISFNLSGPLTLAISVMYFRRTSLSSKSMVRILGIMLGPLLGLAAVCSFSTFGSDDISFDSGESNFQTSGGFGPNQVSSVLGWAIVSAFLWAAFGRRSLACTGLAACLMLFSAMQTALTFSRSGIWMGAICTISGGFFLARNRGSLVTILAIALAISSLAWLVVFPALDSFTHGKLSERYTEKGFGNRETIGRQDIILFAENPLLGVGPGMGKFARKARFHSGGAAHTEFTRLLSEHGMLGVFALSLLLGMGLARFADPGCPQAKAIRCTAIVYSFCFMTVTAMRLALPSFVFGLSFVTIRQWSKQVRRARSSRPASSQFGVARVGWACPAPVQRQ